MRVLVPRLIVLTRLREGVAAESAKEALLGALPVAPLEIHRLPEQILRAGSDMYIFLALENMRIYLAGGILLALVGVLAIALANYAEERHTLALLRIRGASPIYILRFLVAMMLSPALLGLILGSAAGLAAGFGLANYLWKLREIQTAVGLLRTHLVISAATVEIIILLAIFLIVVASLFSLWVFRKTAREVAVEG
jgi:predicted lysophospholipase L1 biosynthesis ABC-type transport system permease subunit